MCFGDRGRWDPFLLFPLVNIIYIMSKIRLATSQVKTINAHGLGHARVKQTAAISNQGLEPRLGGLAYEPAEVLGGGLGHLIHRDTFKLCNALRHMHHIGGLVGLASKWHGRKKRRIGLNK